MKKRVPVLVAAVALALAAWFLFHRAGSRDLVEDSHGDGAQAREGTGEAPGPRLAPAPAMAQDRTAKPPSSPTAAGGDDPQQPAAPSPPRATGTAHLPDGEKPSSWIVVWRRTGSRSAGSADIRDDGSFDLPNGDLGGYTVTLRPRTALWPAVGWQKGAAAGGGVVIAPEPLSAFRVRVEGDLPADHPTAVQVESFEGVPILQLAVSADRPEVEVAGIEDQHRYGVYVGPTSDGRYGSWQGVPKTGESVTVSLRRGATLKGRVEGGTNVDAASRRVELHAFLGADVEVQVTDSGTFEQAGLSAECLWRVVATARSRAGARLRAEATWRPDASEVTLRLEPAKD